MSYQALLFCTDEKTARVLSQILSDLEFQIEFCTEPFAAVKKLAAQPFDAVLVDCDNEQNALLLFKSARHSSFNQSSLAVALVQGQAGIAKAFRIGANLVLTKPINVEQSKATLRTAKGLLRKAEAAAKPAAPLSTPAPIVSAPTISAPRVSSAPANLPFSPAKPTPANPIFAPTRPQSGYSAGPVASASLESEQEPVFKLGAEEAAVLDSLPELPTHSVPSETISVASKSYPWQPVAKAAQPAEANLSLDENDLDAILSQLGPSAPEVSAKPLSTPASPTFSSHGAAAAAAPAREASSREDLVNQEIAAAEAEFSTPFAATAAPDLEPLQETSQEVPSFSLSSYGSDPEAGESSSSKKFVIPALVLLALAGGAYAGWSRLHSAPTPQSTIEVPALPAPAPPVDAVPTSTVPDQAAQNPAPTAANGDPGTEAQPAAENTKPQAGLVSPTSVNTPTPPSPAEEKAAHGASAHVQKAPEPQELIIVQHGTSISKPAQQTVAEAPAPPELGAASSGSSNQALAGIVSSAAPHAKPVFKPVRVSEGISAGLVIKRVQPVYPPSARQMRVEGLVELEANIGKDGSVSNIKVISGKPVLAQAAVEAVRQWKYKPYYLNNEPLEVLTQIKVEFKLPRP